MAEAEKQRVLKFKGQTKDLASATQAEVKAAYEKLIKQYGAPANIPHSARQSFLSRYKRSDALNNLPSNTSKANTAAAMSTLANRLGLNIKPKEAAVKAAQAKRADRRQGKMASEYKEAGGRNLPDEKEVAAGRERAAKRSLRGRPALRPQPTQKKTKKKTRKKTPKSGTLKPTPEQMRDAGVGVFPKSEEKSKSKSKSSSGKMKGKKVSKGAKAAKAAKAASNVAKVGRMAGLARGAGALAGGPLGIALTALAALPLLAAEDVGRSRTQAKQRRAASDSLASEQIAAMSQLLSGQNQRFANQMYNQQLESGLDQVKTSRAVDRQRQMSPQLLALLAGEENRLSGMRGERTLSSADVASMFGGN
tara:strand:+ start:5586 stop:6677 length:1092 start_codon:yes stop_codon:yes gene_type:complete